MASRQVFPIIKLTQTNEQMVSIEALLSTTYHKMYVKDLQTVLMGKLSIFIFHKQLFGTYKYSSCSILYLINMWPDVFHAELYNLYCE